MFGRTINKALGLIGLRLCNAQLYTVLEQGGRYKQLVREIAELTQSTASFPKLPAIAGRIELLTRLEGTGVIEAIFLLSYLQHSLKLDGDICEFGVAQGFTSVLLANETRATNKLLWLFDSFQGLPKPTSKDLLLVDIFNLQSIEEYEGTMAYSADEVRRRLSQIDFPFSRVRIVPGFLENTLRDHELAPRVCFAYVDVDLCAGTLLALRFLHPRLSTGGFVVVDDYGYFTSGPKTAVDQFLEEYQNEYKISRHTVSEKGFCALQKV
jgi:O-methyltransferase